MNFDFAPEFEKDLKNLLKKWPTLLDDVDNSKDKIEGLYIQRDDVDVKQYRSDLFATKKAAILFKSPDDNIEVIKMRLDVEYLGRNDKARIIFIAIKNQDQVMFIELYAKNDKEREDQKRIKKYLKGQ